MSSANICSLRRSVPHEQIVDVLDVDRSPLRKPCIALHGFRSGDVSDISVIVAGVEDCVSDVSSWSAAKRLQLNATKTEILWFGSETSLRKLSPENRVISVGQSVIHCSQLQSSVTLAC